MSVLICENISTEGPGTIGDYLRLKGMLDTIVDLCRVESLPDATSFDVFFMLGGPVSVNDDISYNRNEDELVRDFTSIGGK